MRAHFKKSQTIEIGSSEFTDGSTQGCVEDKAHKIEWNLNFTGNKNTFFHVPRILKNLKLTKSEVCKPNIDIMFSGEFSVDGKKYEVREAKGCQGHIWGSKYPHRWAWAHCNDFKENSNTVIEILSAEVKVGGFLTSPRMTALFFKYDGMSFENKTLIRVLKAESSYGLTVWNFECPLYSSAESFKLRGALECTQNSLSGITYQPPQGGFYYCYNTELANLKLELRSKDDRVVKTFNSIQTTAFETVSQERQANVSLLV